MFKFNQITFLIQHSNHVNHLLVAPEKSLDHQRSNIHSNVTKNSTRASRSKTGTISKVIEALEDVEQFEDVSKGLQIKEFLSIARDFLQKMVRAASIKDSVMSVIYKISDFTYVVSCSSGSTHTRTTFSNTINTRTTGTAGRSSVSTPHSCTNS